MRTRYEAFLNKKSLSAIDPAIYILDIAYDAPRFSMETNAIPGRDGLRVSDRHAQSTSVTIKFEIHDQDIARRQDICRRVQGWAMQGGILTTNDRRGQRLNVICESLPSIDSALRWTKSLSVMLTAYEQPFWEDEQSRRVSISGASGSASLYAPGFGALTRVEADVKNNSSSTINALTLKAGATTFDFTGLSLAPGGTLRIGYDENGLLSIRAGEESKMSSRTSASDDDLMIRTGRAETVSVTAGGSVSAVFHARGLYL